MHHLPHSRAHSYPGSLTRTRTQDLRTSLHVEMHPLMPESIKPLNLGQQLPFLLCSFRTTLAQGP